VTYTTTSTQTYSVTDVEVVMRRFTADIVMIAQSTQAISEQKAYDYSFDVEALAKKGYLKAVDLTLLSGSVEICATKYVIDSAAGTLTTSRPGGVLWRRVALPNLRIILSYAPTYDAAARASMQGKLRIGWVPTTADTSHSTLVRSGGRDYVSNGWGMQRKDYGT